MKLTKQLLAYLFIVSCSQVMAQNTALENKTSQLSIGEKVELQSAILNESRVLNIYLPQGYSSDSSKTYPVIYLLDGSIDEDFIHISGLVQFGSFSWIGMIPESIVVGISNLDRRRDFTFPTNNIQDKEDFPTAGKSEVFINFLEKELQPFIEMKYKTGSTKTVIGQSLGGLLATEILFKRPDMFDNYIIVSPSLWWDDESLLKYTPKAYSSMKSVYIAVGKEGETMERIANELHSKLQLQENKNTHLYFQFLEKQDHGDTLHLAVYDAFEKIFKEE
ncbi:alpha/beta hydrolase [Fulvivirga lutimaris]|uniref:alpha/beta hydrolase n=1 Tax=Fulvivirga lutimaris TaxID=1819566 RepID=UPI0012BC9039|nr:alpha/beta hydrolase-fold protein [Fulvivirga lutimaris]MTI40043.1 alpha/beta hydrolase [Fulvivirga lutimaris]